MTTKHAIGLGSLAICSLYVLGCGGGSSDESTVLTPPSLEIRSIVGAGTSGWIKGKPSSCVELGKDRDQTIVLQTNVRGDWLLRPFKTCDNGAQCGFIEASVVDEAGRSLLTRTAATKTIELPFAGLAEPEGQRQFKVRLLSDDGTEFFIGDGGTVCSLADDCSVTVEVRKNCGTEDGDASTTHDAGIVSDASTDADVAIPDAAVSDATVSPDAEPPSDAATADDDAAAAMDSGTALADATADASLESDASLSDASDSGLDPG